MASSSTGVDLAENIDEEAGRTPPNRSRSPPPRRFRVRLLSGRVLHEGIITPGLSGFQIKQQLERLLGWCLTHITLLLGLDRLADSRLLQDCAGRTVDLTVVRDHSEVSVVVVEDTAPAGGEEELERQIMRAPSSMTVQQLLDGSVQHMALEPGAQTLMIRTDDYMSSLEHYMTAMRAGARVISNLPSSPELRAVVGQLVQSAECLVWVAKGGGRGFTYTRGGR